MQCPRNTVDQLMFAAINVRLLTNQSISPAINVQVFCQTAKSANVGIIVGKNKTVWLSSLYLAIPDIGTTT